MKPFSGLVSQDPLGQENVENIFTSEFCFPSTLTKLFEQRPQVFVENQNYHIPPAGGGFVWFPLDFLSETLFRNKQRNRFEGSLSTYLQTFSWEAIPGLHGLHI